MADRERFVDKRTGDLTGSLAALRSEQDTADFGGFSRIVAALYHFDFLDREQRFIEAWDAVSAQDNGSADAADVITGELSGLLDAANYTEISMEELDEALNTESLIPLRFDVNLDDYDELLIYRRGERSESVEVKKFFGLKTESKDITVDERVVIHTRVKQQTWFDRNEFDPADRNLVPGNVSLSQFQNVPRADIEMLLPSTQVKFRLIDTLMIGVPAVAGAVAVLLTKLLSTVALIAVLVGAWVGLNDEAPELDQAALLILFGGTIALGSFGFKQWTKLKNRKVDYLKTLSENLYFRTLATGPGVVHTLLSSAEQQEVAEVLLGYHFIDASGGCSESELDGRVEAWLAAEMGHDIDFDVDDSVTKLRALGLVSGDSNLSVLPLPAALEVLDARWDGIFSYSRPTSDTPPAGDTNMAAEGQAPPLLRLRQLVGRFRGGREKRATEREYADQPNPLAD